MKKSGGKMRKKIKKQQKQYMEIAIELAKKSYENGDVPVGAIVVYKGEIIGIGYNKKELEQNAIKHAEIIAIEEACNKLRSWRLDNCILYVTLEPCLMCSGAIIQSRISKVIYAAKSEKFGFIDYVENIFKNPKHNHKIEIIQGDLEKESQKLLQTFFESKRG